MMITQPGHKQQKRRLQKVINIAGPRYTPELNVELPIASVFEALTRTRRFWDELRRPFLDLNKEYSYAGRPDVKKIFRSKYRAVGRSLNRLHKLVKNLEQRPFSDIPFPRLNSLILSSIRETEVCIVTLEKLKESEGQQPQEEKDPVHPKEDKYRSEIHHFRRLKGNLRSYADDLQRTEITLTNHPELLVHGMAGIGKTHLFCDVARLRLAKRLPTLIFLGEELTNPDPLKSIMAVLKLRSRTTHFVRDLETIARKKQTRFLIMIDAVNEARAKILWDRLIPVTRSKRIAVALSIRTGFEREAFRSSFRKTLVQIRHQGFAYRDWEAVTKFFKEYKIRLPDFPLLLPEFQVPLFLKIFCETYKGREDIPKGHEGATKLFERYVVRQSEPLIRGLGMKKKDKLLVWNGIIKDGLVKWMADRGEYRIPEKEAIKIIEQILPKRSKLALDSLQKYWILNKSPHYSEVGKVCGYDFTFPYQRFSDHLIVRYLLNTHLTDKTNPARHFVPTEPLGKIIFGWNRGLIEALAIQVPERLDGIDLVDVAPQEFRSLQNAQESFLESLIWRSLAKRDGSSKCFNVSTILRYVNEHIIKTQYTHDRLLDTFLSVAAIPGHPLNALFLHKHLSKLSLPKRDSMWIPFLHRHYGESSAVDRLIAWSWEGGDKSHISNESIELAGISLAWFLASSHRSLRDRSTKALVSLFSNRLTEFCDVLRMFTKVNDPYIAERLYCVANGVALRNNKKDPNGLRILAELVYKTVFGNGKPPVHILLRDYARGTITAVLHYEIRLRINQRKIRSPYGSVFPTKIPTEKWLEKKYDRWTRNRKGRDRSYSSIWASVMSFGDFSRYVIESRVGHWSGRRFDAAKADGNKLLREFQARLSAHQKTLWGNAYPSYGASFPLLLRVIVRREGRNVDESEITEVERQEEAAKKEALTALKASFTKDQRATYEKQLKLLLDENGRVRDPQKDFDPSIAKRWIFKRVIDLGWEPKLHGDFDHMVNYHDSNRSAHKEERIGKKYQWIALHEFIARVADNFLFKGDHWSHTSTKYNGPWETWMRDIDPSCLLKGFPENQDSLDEQSAWWFRLRYGKWNRRRKDKSWLELESDLPSIPRMMRVKDRSRSGWFLLDGFFRWEQGHEIDEERYGRPRRDLWIMVRSYIVAEKHLKALHAWALKQNFMGRWMPEPREFHEAFLREYPWAEMFKDEKSDHCDEAGWVHKTYEKGNFPAKILPAVDEYVKEGSSFDCSMEGGFRVMLPTKWIFENMHLRPSENDGVYVNASGEAIVMDPSAREPGPSTLIIRADSLQRFLEEKRCGIFWTILGEKGVIGGDIGPANYPGRLEFSGAYMLTKEATIIGKLHFKFDSPKASTVGGVTKNKPR